MTRVCPRAGRHPVRRKKNLVLAVLGALAILGIVQMFSYNGSYMPMLPLADAVSEAQRLLKFITHYHIHCNNTFQVGNRSHWPLCLEKDHGLDLDVRDHLILYTIGGQGDFAMEKSLALNYSVQVYLVGPDNLPHMERVNNTRVIQTAITPNDYADFSRNSYGQQTLNNLMTILGHDHIDILRIAHTVSSVQTWELLRFMISDNLLLKVRQLHVAMYIDKIEEDYLYSWYRVVYELFYKQGMRLYHTSSSDSLCVQVTMMQSCVYYLSFVRNPGPKTFVLHPPADFGSSELEETRLLSLISFPQLECKQMVIGADQASDPVTVGQPQWQVCSNSIYEVFKKPCNVWRFRSSNDHKLEKQMIEMGCSIHTLEPVVLDEQPIVRFKMHGHHPKNKNPSRSKGHPSTEKTLEEVFQLLSEEGLISLMEIDVPQKEWEVLGHILDSGVLFNVTQVVAEIQLPDNIRGRHPTVLRTHYSELKRLESQGFRLFYSSPSSAKRLAGQTSREQENCCFKLGFVNQRFR